MVKVTLMLFRIFVAYTKLLHALACKGQQPGLLLALSTTVSRHI
jgi:hypothetical protein